MVLDPRERFSETAGDYDRWRPTYPPELLDWLREATGVRPPATVVDVGCGTGISTRLFAALGYKALGVEPNEAMLAKAREHGEADYLRGEAAATGLPSGYASLVVAAQAFHWFDQPAALAEFRRLVAPGGWNAAFWNVRQHTPFLKEYEAVLKQFATEYGSDRPEEALAALRGDPAVREWREASFANRQELDWDGFLGRLRSASYVAHGIRKRGEFDRAMRAAFDRHQSGGKVAFDYLTKALCWKPATRG